MEVAKVEVVEPAGWVVVHLQAKEDSVRAFMLQVCSTSSVLRTVTLTADTPYTHC